MTRKLARRSSVKLVAGSADETEWGPAMRALTSRQRNFVLYLFQLPSGHGVQTKACRLAGYKCSNPPSWAALASRLVHDERIQAAMKEHGERVLRGAAPRALQALGGVLEDAAHPGHIKGIQLALNYSLPPAPTTHNVIVSHQHRIADPAQVQARIAELLNLAGLSPEQLPPPIEGEYSEVTDEAGDDA